VSTLDVEVSVGARLASIRQARPAMAQQDLADAVGVNRMTIHRWEVGATRVPEDRLPALATALRVSQETITRRRGEAVDVCDLMVQAGAVVEQPPAPLGADSLGCICMVLRFELFARLQSRIAVVCAPVVGQHQIKRVLAALPELGLIHHLIFVSEEAPDRSSGWEMKRAEPFPELHLLRRAELESHLFSLAALARATAALAETLPSSELEPRLVLSTGDGEPRPIQSALWCWLCESESPYHLVLVGGPGSGKTVSARRFAVALAKAFLDAPEMRPCPVYVQLSTLIDATDLRMRLTQEIRMQLGIQSRAPVERAMETGRLVLILE
jgi:DNA-binding XRE family transcriptional regulator